MSTVNKRGVYTTEYRREAAHLVIDTGRTIKAVSSSRTRSADTMAQFVQQPADHEVRHRVRGDQFECDVGSRS